MKLAKLAIALAFAATVARLGEAARVLAAVLGVTGLAIDVAQSAGVALAGFARGQDLTLYAHEERLVWPEGS